MLIKNIYIFPGGNNKNAAEIKKHAFFKGIDWDELKSKRRKAPFKPNLDSEDDTQNFSEEFTKQPVIDSPAPVPVNTHRLFRGYSYVAPQHLKSRKVTQNVYDVEYCKEPVMVRAHIFKFIYFKFIYHALIFLESKKQSAHTSIG